MTLYVLCYETKLAFDNVEVFKRHFEGTDSSSSSLS